MTMDEIKDLTLIQIEILFDEHGKQLKEKHKKIKAQMSGKKKRIQLVHEVAHFVE